MAYGAGQGFAQGVQNVAGMILPAMQQKRREQMYYDRLALDQAWKDGFYGGSSPLSGGAKVDGSGKPYQVTREEHPGFIRKLFGGGGGSGSTSGEVLAGGMADPLNPVPARTFQDPTRPAPAAPAPAYGPAGPMGRQPNIVAPKQGFRPWAEGQMKANAITPDTELPPKSMMRGGGFRRPY